MLCKQDMKTDSRTWLGYITYQTKQYLKAEYSLIKYEHTGLDKLAKNLFGGVFRLTFTMHGQQNIVMSSYLLRLLC